MTKVKDVLDSGASTMDVAFSASMHYTPVTRALWILEF